MRGLPRGARGNLSLRLPRRFPPRDDNQASCHCEPAEGGRGNLVLRKTNNKIALLLSLLAITTIPTESQNIWTIMLKSL